MEGTEETEQLKAPSKRPTKQPTLKSQVSAKMALADIQGRVRILTSRESI